MQQKTTQTLYAYWNEVRAGRIAPRRFEIEPSRIAGILAETFILERVDGETFRYRLAGTRICEQFGQEFRGSNFLDSWSPDDQDLLAKDLASITSLGGISLLTFEAGTSDDGFCTFEAVLLPLVHTNQTVDRFLGAISAIDAPGWLGTRRLGERRLTGHDLIWPDGRPHTLVERAQAQTPFHPSMQNARLVRSDRRQFRVYDGGLSQAENEK